jgi:hypothetical protein
MENRLKYLIVVLWFLSSCSTIKYLPEDLKGVYLQEGAPNVQFVLNDRTFLYVDTYMQMDAPPYKCCDTLAYGSWSIDKGCGLLILNSPEELNTSYINMDVKEKSELSSDSLYFFIYNPIENHYKEYNEKYRELFYSLLITSDSPDFDARLAVKEFDVNPIKQPKPKSNIESFSIKVIPKHNIPVQHIGVREIYTLDYNVKNPNSNVFIIKLPQLSYNYINYLRLVGDYVKIESKNKLIWNGKEYVKHYHSGN